jgi:hypothetical protein
MKRYFLCTAIFFLPNCTCSPTVHHEHSHAEQAEHAEHSENATEGPSLYKDHTGQETVLRFGEAYTYNPETDYARPDYKQPKTITYNADGTGTFLDEDKATGKFKWHFTPETNGGEMIITEWYDTVDTGGAPAPEKDKADIRVVQHIMESGTGIHENGSDRIYEISK